MIPTISWTVSSSLFSKVKELFPRYVEPFHQVVDNREMFKLRNYSLPQEVGRNTFSVVAYGSVCKPLYSSPVLPYYE